MKKLASFAGIPPLGALVAMQIPLLLVALGAASAWPAFVAAELVAVTSVFGLSWLSRPAAAEPAKDQAGLVELLDQRVHELEEVAVTDPLTGVFNRRYCTERLEQDIARASRDDKPLSLIFLDVDDFKVINDTVGHLVGDRALQHVASIAASHARHGDWVTRWGGDEFLIVLWNADADQAGYVCRRIDEALAFGPPPGMDRLVRVSFGIHQYQPGDNAETMLSQVDDALRTSKRGGDGRGRAYTWP